MPTCRPGVRDALAADPDAKAANAVAAHPGLGEDRLRTMAARRGVQVFARVAANPDAPSALLVDLVRHDPPVPRILRTVAEHPNATAPTLRACLTDPKARRHAAAHPALSGEDLPGLIDNAGLAVVKRRPPTRPCRPP